MKFLKTNKSITIIRNGNVSIFSEGTFQFSILSSALEKSSKEFEKELNFIFPEIGSLIKINGKPGIVIEYKEDPFEITSLVNNEYITINKNNYFVMFAPNKPEE